MGEKSAFFTVCFSSVREGLNIIIRGIVGFCFGDRDFMTSSPPQTSFSFSGERKRGKKKDRSGDCAATGSRPSRPPGERASRERQTTEMLCTAEKVSAFGQKMFVREPRGTIRLSLPLRGEAKESVRGRVFNSPRSDLSALCGLY